MASNPNKTQTLRTWLWDSLAHLLPQIHSPIHARTHTRSPTHPSCTRVLTQAQQGHLKTSQEVVAGFKDTSNSTRNFWALHLISKNPVVGWFRLEKTSLWSDSWRIFGVFLF